MVFRPPPTLVHPKVTLSKNVLLVVSSWMIVLCGFRLYYMQTSPCTYHDSHRWLCLGYSSNLKCNVNFSYTPRGIHQTQPLEYLSMSVMAGQWNLSCTVTKILQPLLPSPRGIGCTDTKGHWNFLPPFIWRLSLSLVLCFLGPCLVSLGSNNDAQSTTTLHQKTLVNKSVFWK